MPQAALSLRCSGDHVRRLAQPGVLYLGVTLKSLSTKVADAFAAMARERVGGLVVSSDPFFLAQIDQFASLATRYKIPTIYAYRDQAAAVGLLSYGINVLDGLRTVGIYVGRILKGEKPADLRVMLGRRKQ